MFSSFHKSKSLRYLAIWPDNYDPSISYPLVVMLHGFGSNMQDLMFVAPAISTSGYVYLCPNAPIPFDMGLGRTGYGWTPPRDQVTPKDVEKAENVLSLFIDQMIGELDVVAGQTLLLGFSQGGAMTYRCGLERPETFRGLVALSSSMPDPNVVQERLPTRRDQPIFMAHGRYDSPESLERAQATWQFLTEQGYQPDYHEYNIGHEIPAVVLRDLTPWVAKVLPPWCKDE